MKIVFILGTFQLEHDGVADYTFTLAAELISLGHSAGILAIEDTRLSASSLIAEEIHWVGSIASTYQEIHVLRLSRSLPWSSRAKASLDFFSRQDPDWLSLQFVPFSFNSKGLPFRLGHKLVEIKKFRPFHIMFHELWVGWKFPVAVKSRFLGILQRVLIRDMLGRTRPQAVTTSNELYKKMLSGISQKSDTIPVHSNIKCTSNYLKGRRWLLAKLGLKEGNKLIMIGFFGNILPSLVDAQLGNLLDDYCARGRTVYVLSAGKLTYSSILIWNRLSFSFSKHGTFCLLGSLPPESLSCYLAGIDEGLTSYPIELSGKSGGVAAFLAHQTSVRCLGKSEDLASNGDTIILPRSETSTSYQASYTACLMLEKLQGDYR